MKLNRRDVLKLAAAVPLVGPAMADAAPQLKIISRVLEVNGKAAKVFGIVGPDGKPGLSMIYGQPFRAALKNFIGEETAIHWHGLTPPVALDGVPMLVGPTLKPGDTRNYEFSNQRIGTHWMHSHLGLQEQQLLAAPLIVHETAKPVFDEQEHVVMLHDFTFRAPEEILAELKRGGGGHSAHMKMEGMVMSGDVKFDALLANDRTLDDPEIVSVEKGGVLRLRLINAAAATNMWVELGGLEAQLIAVDGNAVKPLVVSRFPLGVAQRADIRVKIPIESGAWPIIFLAEGEKLRGAIFVKSAGGTVHALSQQTTPGEAFDLKFESRLQVPYEFKKSELTQHETIRLTGGENSYLWGFNDTPMMHDVLFKVRKDSRVEITMQNQTAMAHPMHLHGHYFQVTAINGKPLEGAQRDTILVPAGESVSIQFEADNPGLWAFHCHHLYHMNSGMMAAMGYV